MKLKIWDDSMAEGQHEGQSVSFPEPHWHEKTKGNAGFTPHSRYMRPQAKKIKVCNLCTTTFIEAETYLYIVHVGRNLPDQPKGRQGREYSK